MTNRITAAVVRLEKQIAERISKGLTTQAKVDALHATLDMSVEEHAKFQEYKTLAYAEGKLNFDEAQLLYEYLGECVSVFNARPIAVKSVLTSLLGELLKIRIASRQAV
jgi:hypothetical protein